MFWARLRKSHCYSYVLDHQFHVLSFQMPYRFLSSFSPSPQKVGELEVVFYCRFYVSGCALYFSFPDSGNFNYFSFDSRNAKSIQQTTSQLCLPEWLIKTNWITLWLHAGTPWPSPTNSRFGRVFLCFYLPMNSVAWLEGMFAQPGAQYMKSWEVSRRLEKEVPRLRYQGIFRIEFGEYVCRTKSLLMSPPY